MLKKIAVQDVRLGMYIHAFAGSWLDHPFWRSKFLLEDPADLQLVRQSAVREVWIDVGKGADVAAEAVSVAQAASAEQVEEALRQDRAVERSLAPTSTSSELMRAAAICKSAKHAITSMFSDARMGKAIDQAVARQVAEDIADSVIRNGHALISLARLKTTDDYTYMHSVAVCALMVALARRLGLPDEEVRAAGFAGLLHDLGKMDVPLEVLNKPGRLTDEEFELVRQHPAKGHERLLVSGIHHEQALEVCLYHHEKLDGTGYPHRLAGPQVSLMARMGAVCDVYDAITSNRPYKAGWDPAESLARMAQWVDSHLDGRVFQAFVRSLGVYPVGSLVLLSNGKLAVVVDQSRGSLLKPVVKTVFSVNSYERVVPELIDLSSPSCRHTIVKREDPAKWRISGLDEVWAGSLAA
jgi:HD-GYP domain-containing protein (c-di-GMP phosphodiesterase class II)